MYLSYTIQSDHVKICIHAFISISILNNVVHTNDHMIHKTPHFCQQTEANRYSFISNTSGFKQLCTLSKLNKYTRMGEEA